MPQYPSINPFSENVEKDEPINTSHFYSASLPAEPLSSSIISMDGNTAKIKAKELGQIKLDHRLQRPLQSLLNETTNEELNQIDSFTEIMESLNAHVNQSKTKDVQSPTRSQALDLALMASPLGPSQVDIGNLSSRRELPNFMVRKPPAFKRASQNSERRAFSAMMMSRDMPTIFINETSSRKLQTVPSEHNSVETEKMFQMWKMGRQERSASLPSTDISVCCVQINITLKN